MEVRGQRELTGLKTKAVLISSRSFRVDPFPYLFLLLESTYLPWLLLPLYVFKVGVVRPQCVLSGSLLLPLPRLRILMITLGLPGNSG